MYEDKPYTDAYKTTNILHIHNITTRTYMLPKNESHVCMFDFMIL